MVVGECPTSDTSLATLAPSASISRSLTATTELAIKCEDDKVANLKKHRSRNGIRARQFGGGVARAWPLRKDDTHKLKGVNI